MSLQLNYSFVNSDDEDLKIEYLEIKCVSKTEIDKISSNLQLLYFIMNFLWNVWMQPMWPDVTLEEVNLRIHTKSHMFQLHPGVSACHQQDLDRGVNICGRCNQRRVQKAVQPVHCSVLIECAVCRMQCTFLLKRVQQVKEYRNTNINTQRFAQNTLLYSLAGCAPLYSRFTLIAGVQS